MNKIERVVNSRQCVGCGLCAAVSDPGKVEMKLSPEGFLRPYGISSLSASQVETIAGSCRGLQSDYVKSSGSKLHPDENFDFMWGSYFDCKTGYSSNDELRYRASSGGAISEIASWMVTNNMADRVLATDYAVHDKLRAHSAFATEAAAITEMSGSKYCPSSPLELIRDLFSPIGDRVVVIGRPCDISTIRMLINNGKIKKERVALLISFFCAGTPSDSANEKLVKLLGANSRDEIEKFKHRGDGWPGNTTVTLNDGRVLSTTYAKSWGGVLNKDLQFGCKICADGIGEAADIVAADAWFGDESGYPDFNESDGRSLIITRTSLGQKILKSIEDDSCLITQSENIRSIDRMQPGQLKRRRYLRNRIIAMKLLLLATPKYNSIAIRGYQVNVKLKDKISASVGTITRLARSYIKSRK